MQATKLSISAARKTYRTAAAEVLALKDVNIDIADGDFVSIVGPSGCGKTTLLWSIAGLHQLSSGNISLDGAVIRGPHKQIGMMFQHANLLPWRDLSANMALPFEIRSQPVDNDRIATLVKRVGLSGFEHSMPKELSGGMQQRAAIVRALAPNPDVLLMDEPFGALDAFTREEMNLLIEEIWMETGKTVVLITHSIEEAVFLSNRVHVLSARPGQLQRSFEVPFPRKRSLDLVRTQQFFDLVNKIKALIRESTPGRDTQEAGE